MSNVLMTKPPMPYPSDVRYACPCGPAPAGSDRPGYVTLTDGRIVCVPFAARYEVESGALAEALASDRVTGYIMGDPTRTDDYKVTYVTSYLGNRMLHVTEAHYGERRYSGHPDTYFYTGSSYAPLYFRAVDKDGAAWRGWGNSEHNRVTVRRVKPRGK